MNDDVKMSMKQSAIIHNLIPIFFEDKMNDEQLDVNKYCLSFHFFFMDNR